MKAKIIFSSLEDDGCAGSACPTIYETDVNTYLIQGKLIKDSKLFNLSIPEDEVLIELPKTFVDRFKNQ